jgi:hypothetical protein
MNAYGFVPDPIGPRMILRHRERRLNLGWAARMMTASAKKFEAISVQRLPANDEDPRMRY